MRAVKSIIQAAGRHRSENPNEADEIIAYNCLTESNLPKLVSEDVSLFKAIISDLFPKIKIDEEDNSKLK
jgi:dynein heavy chain